MLPLLFLLLSLAFASKNAILTVDVVLLGQQLILTYISIMLLLCGMWYTTTMSLV